MTIRLRHLINLAAILVLFATIVMVVAHLTIAHAERSHEAARLQGRCEAVVDRMDHRCSLLTSAVRRLAESGTLPRETGWPEEVVDVSPWLEEWTRSHPWVEGLLLLDPSGQGISGVGTPPADLALHPCTRRLIERGTATYWVASEGTLHRVSMLPVSDGTARVGLLLGTYVVDTESLVELGALLGTELALIHDEAVVAHTLGDDPDMAAAMTLLALPSPGEDRPHVVDLAGQRFLSMETALDSGSGGERVQLAVLTPVDRIASMSRTLALRVWLIAMALALVSVGLATLSSRAVLRPIDQLIAVARRAANGDTSPVRQHTDIPEIAVLEDAMTDLLRQQQRLVRRAGKEAQRERDVEIGAWIQASVTPESPDLPGLDLAAGTWRDPDAGGDYYDMLQAGDELWLAIGDVAARGLRAGMLATLLHGAVRAAIGVRPDASPSSVLRALDPLFSRYLSTVGWSDAFVALRLVRLSPDGAVRFAGAHQEMVLQRAGEARTIRLDWHGTWLGLGDDGGADDPDGALTLAPGDTLVLVTDGLLGAVDATGRYFGMAGLTRIVEEAAGQPARVVRDRLMTAWSAWAVSPDDDATVIVVRRRAGG